MFLLQVTSTLKKSICNYVLFHQTSKLCRTCFKEIYIHPGTIHRSYSKETESQLQSNIVNDLKFNEEQQTEINNSKNESKTRINNIFTSHDINYIDKLFPNPVGSLTNIYTIVNNEFNLTNSLSYNYEIHKQNSSKKQMIKCTINILWPSEMSFTSVGQNRKAAVTHAAKTCLNWLHVNKKITTSRPILYSKKEINEKMNELVTINLESNLKNEIKIITDIFDNEIKAIVTTQSTANPEESVSKQDKMGNFFDFKRLSKDNILKKERQSNRVNDKDLPIVHYKRNILYALEHNQVLLIKGDTGCGKSTQVPQFIIDEYIVQNKVHKCNILVSEPRRISAISLANYVAAERNEDVGQTIGYQVRLKHIIPKLSGSILFCTTGILLRRMQANPSLRGVSHIIMDESHERTLQIDILLNLLKKVLKTNPDLKLIIMSATMNAELFQQYFSCVVIDVPGKMYPVKMHFMDDIDIFKRQSLNAFNSKNIEVPFKETIGLIRWISKNKPPGAILCFLPGWKEIQYVYNGLYKNFHDSGSLILRLHSKLSHNEQDEIFNPAPPNVRKIILATDIAESSITIKDVSYVIDTVIKKETCWNNTKCLYGVSNVWISQANICQRKGRAGRVKPGESYHLISKEAYNTLQLFPVPEITRTALEGAILISKMYSNEKVHDFFNNMIEVPNKTSVNQAIHSLEQLDILDENENLTALGKRVIYFSLEPRLSRALLFACVFQCLNPILSIVSLHTTDNEMSATSLNDKSTMREMKQKLHNSSDHIAMLQYYMQSKNSLSRKLNMTLYILSKICELHLTEAIDSGIISLSQSDDMNTNSKHNELIRAILFSASNQVIRQSNYGYKNGHFTTHENTLISQDRKKIILSTDSVNYKRKLWPSPFLTYLNKLEYIQQHICVVPDTSMISPLSVLLFNQNDVRCSKRDRNDFDNENSVTIEMNNLENVQLCCDEETANLLLKFRDILWNTVNYIIQYEGDEKQTENLNTVKSYRSKLMSVLVNLLRESSKNIDASEVLYNSVKSETKNF
ncbi:ATP-dependent RNA helicase DHX30-like [Colletes gigas]|uniref:ATP-dependent RNA helicase DHX30-like n=1 Tax=Colletes gigas TaxID=935657 RepID=UPI001C9A71D5|nr:ATP-dependent RNA helicase DHX30-like [Colletes gigas]